MVPNAQDDVVRLFHALCDSRDAAHAHDEEVHPAFFAEFPQERPQGVLRSPGRDAAKRALAQTWGVPQTKRVRAALCFPRVSARAGRDAADVVGGGRAVRAGDEVYEGAFADAGFTCDDDVAEGEVRGEALGEGDESVLVCVSPEPPVKNVEVPYLDWLSDLAIALDCVGVSEGVSWCDGLNGSRRVNLKIGKDTLSCSHRAGRLRGGKFGRMASPRQPRWPQTR